MSEGLQLNNLKRGFTLVELVVTMAIYSILLVIMSITLVSVSRLNKEFVIGNTYDDVLKIESFLTEMHKRYNGEIIFNYDSLMEVENNKIFFEDGTLYFESDEKIQVVSNQNIQSIARIINDNKITYEIFYEDQIKSIVLFNVGDKT